MRPVSHLGVSTSAVTDPPPSSAGVFGKPPFPSYNALVACALFSVHHRYTFKGTPATVLGTREMVGKMTWVLLEC